MKRLVQTVQAQRKKEDSNVPGTNLTAILAKGIVSNKFKKIVIHDKQFENVQREIRERQKRLQAPGTQRKGRRGGAGAKAGQQAASQPSMQAAPDPAAEAAEAAQAQQEEQQAAAAKKMAEEVMSRHDTSYIDKHRAGVDGTSKDLLTALRRKAEEDRRKGINKDVEGTQWITFYQEGLRCLNRGYVLPALRSFGRAIDLNENCPEAHVARANSYLRLGKPQKALDDTNEAEELRQKSYLELKELLKNKYYQEENQIDLGAETRRLQKLRVNLMHCRAEALYELSMFERSLIYYYRCVRARPDMALEFREGVKKAYNAIANSLSQKCFENCPDLNEVRNVSEYFC